VEEARWAGELGLTATRARRGGVGWGLGWVVGVKGGWLTRGGRFGLGTETRPPTRRQPPWRRGPESGVVGGEEGGVPRWHVSD
jgi:hypothetical protein